jgi:shikimate dehydrogenase
MVAPPTEARKLLIGLIGSGMARSLSPALHEVEASHHGIRLHYQLIDLDAAGVQDLPALVMAMRRIGFDGFNVTFPCKQSIMPLLDELDDEARRMGAVNTVVRVGERLVGYNTDGAGWARGLQHALPDGDLSHVVLLGAGGAGSAIAHAALGLGVGRLDVVDQDPARAQALVADLNRAYGTQRAHAVADLAVAMAQATGLVHATPVGMDKTPGLPLPTSLLRPALWVSEVVYLPIETTLLKAARAIGCRTADGGGMTVGQAVLAFRRFTGLAPDEGRMAAHFRSLLAARGNA